MTFTPGTRLARYEILALLGGGGMGEGYEAKDHRLDRRVAIKVLPRLRDGEREDAWVDVDRQLAAMLHGTTRTAAADVLRAGRAPMVRA